MAQHQNGVVGVYSAGPSTGTDSNFSGKLARTHIFNFGVIIDVSTPDQARLAQEAGACAVMVTENFAADIRTQNVVSRMSDPQIIRDIKNAVTIPVFAKTRIGDTTKAQILQQIGADFIDESEVLTPADQEHHINKHNFETPFICACKNLGEALHRVHEGAVMLRTEGDAGAGNVVEAVQQMRSIINDIRRLRNMDDNEILTFSSNISAPYDLVMLTKQLGFMPVMLFGAGGIVTPADAVLMMQLRCHGVIVGSGIFMSEDPVERARAIVEAVTHFHDPGVLAEVSSGFE